ncbi:flavodoxin domain-containing protein [Kocuria sp. M1R5S2]|uniref:flavodoxin domain-containing protein n=1 Tax=Kocuria rhizosphaerae TaxID=3376285 RepID=UPI003789DF65
MAHASAHGSTTEIAQRIADVLRHEGAVADVVPVGRIEELEAYDAVVLGSAVHGQAWLPAATEFVHRRAAELRARPVWLFSVGMSGGLPRIVRGAARSGQDRRLADALRDVARPRGHRLFSGVCRQDQLPRWGGVLFRGMGGHFGDYRDWTAIEAWAREIAEELAPGPATPPGKP